MAESPSHLHVLGQIAPTDRMAIAIVGTRSPSSIGKVVAFELARDLAAASVTVVSGLAAGIDAEAHKGAMSIRGGRTIACLGGGVDHVYPRCNEKLFRSIPCRGALVSEYSDGTHPSPWRFPARNRIISGISLGVVVVEAGEKSGALITADWALKQGRPVMAVPGSIKSRTSIGSNRLIQDGAYLVTSAQEILSYMGEENRNFAGKTVSVLQNRGQLTFDEALILKEIEGKMLTGDEIIDLMPSLGPGRIMSLLSSLEVKGVLERLSGGRYLVTK